MKFRYQNIFQFNGVFESKEDLILWGREILLREPSPLSLNPLDTELDFNIFLTAWENVPIRTNTFWTINLFIYLSEILRQISFFI